MFWRRKNVRFKKRLSTVIETSEQTRRSFKRKPPRVVIDTSFVDAPTDEAWTYDETEDSVFATEVEAGQLAEAWADDGLADAQAAEVDEDPAEDLAFADVEAAQEELFEQPPAAPAAVNSALSLGEAEELRQLLERFETEAKQREAAARQEAEAQRELATRLEAEAHREAAARAAAEAEREEAARRAEEAQRELERVKLEAEHLEVSMRREAEAKLKEAAARREAEAQRELAARLEAEAQREAAARAAAEAEREEAARRAEVAQRELERLKSEAAAREQAAQLAAEAREREAEARRAAEAEREEAARKAREAEAELQRVKRAAEAREDAARLEAQAGEREAEARREVETQRALAARLEAEAQREAAARAAAEAEREAAARRTQEIERELERIKHQNEERERVARIEAEAREREDAARREAEAQRELAVRLEAEAQRQAAARAAAEAEREAATRQAAEALRELAALKAAAEHAAAQAAANPSAHATSPPRSPREILTSEPSADGEFKVREIGAIDYNETGVRSLRFGQKHTPAPPASNTLANAEKIVVRRIKEEATAQPETPREENPRNHKRAQSSTPASVWNKDMSQPLSCTICDRSPGGALLQFPPDPYTDEITELFVGDEVTLTIPGSHERTTVPCQVLWITGRRCGVKFIGQFKAEPNRPKRSPAAGKPAAKSAPSRTMVKPKR